MAEVTDLPADLVQGFGISMVTRAKGGRTAEVYRARTPTGPLFVKTIAEPADGFFAAESAGLRALARTRSVPVPLVLRTCSTGLVLQWIPGAGGHPHTASGGSAATSERFGRDLAAMHSSHGRHFGSIDGTSRGFLGTVGLDLTPESTWAQSYLHRRVVPLTRRAIDGGRLDESAWRRVQRLLDRGPEVCGPPELPSLVHGDLWHGNVVLDHEHRHWLVDPSAHYGHRELDLALMRLFGGFSEAVYAAYAEVAPLAPGWGDRIAVHQLAQLLVNAICFGDDAHAAVSRRLSRLGV